MGGGAPPSSLRVGGGVLGGDPIEHDDAVRQVGGHDEVVLHHEGRLLGVEDESAQGEDQQQSLKHVDLSWKKYQSKTIPFKKRSKIIRLKSAPIVHRPINKHEHPMGSSVGGHLSRTV